MSDLIRFHFDIELTCTPEEELRIWLENRIAKMLEQETDLLMSTLYRLDVDERKILRVLKQTDQGSIPRGLASLVLDRQRERQATRQAYRGDRTTFYWGEEE